MNVARLFADIRAKVAADYGGDLERAGEQMFDTLAELWALAYADGVTAERDRVCALLKAGLLSDTIEEACIAVATGAPAPKAQAAPKLRVVRGPRGESQG